MRKVFFSIAMVLLVIVALEILLHGLAFAIPRVDQVLRAALTSIPHAIPDARLGHRPNPEYPGHDARGFRNRSVPERAEIVALGDSQTYGVGVGAEEAWPKRVQAKSRRAVYSMAYGGYGPAHALLLWDEAVLLEPDCIVVALYAGNDLFDSFDLVYNRGQLASLRHADPAVREAVRASEAQDPIAARVSRVFRSETGVADADEEEEESERFSTRRFLARYSRLQGLVRSVEQGVRGLRDRLTLGPDAEWQEAKRFAARHPEFTSPFEDGPRRTIFTGAYRLVALNLEDARIAEGQRISLEAIRRMHGLAGERGARFLVVLIPTKELVFSSEVASPSAELREMTRNELRFWRSTIAFLEHHGVDYVESLPGLRHQLAEGEQPYPVSHDGHLNRFGHEVIAELVGRKLAG